MQSQTLSLFGPDHEFNQLPSTEEMEEAVLEGVEHQAAYAGRVPLQCFTVKVPLPVYLAFKKEVQRWQREAEAADPSAKKRYTMTTFVIAALKEVILPGLKKRSPQIPTA